MANKLEFTVALRDQFTKGMNKVEGGFKRSVNNIQYSFRTLATLPALLAAAAPVVAVKKMLDASMEMRAIAAKMGAAIPSFGAAGRELNFISAEADRMGISFKTVAGEYANFAASATRVGISVGDTRETFVQMSEAAVSLSLSSEQTGRIFNALSQMASKGVVSMEELRQQLGDSLPAAAQIGARAMGMTSRAFIDAVSKGEIMAKDFIPAFAKQVRQELGGSFEESSNLMQASINRMSNAWFKFSSGLGSLFSGDIKTGIDGVTRAINFLSENMRAIKAVFDTLAVPVVVVWNEVQNVALAAKALAGTFATVIDMALVPFIEGFSLVAETVNLAGRGIRDLATGNFKGLATFGEAFGNVKDHASTFLQMEKALFASHNAEWQKFTASTDKNYQDMANAAAKAWVSIQNASLKTAPGSVEPVREKARKEESPAIDEKEMTRQAKLRQKWIDDGRKRDVEDAKARYNEKLKAKKLEAEADQLYQETRAQNIMVYGDREMALLDLKYAKEREKYRGNTKALLSIEKAYNIERAAIVKATHQQQIQAATDWVGVIAGSLQTVAEENKEFTGAYKAAAIAQIIADTAIAAQSAYRSMVQAFGAYGVPAGIAAAAVVSAAGAVRVGQVAKQKFGQGVRSFRTSGIQTIIVGDNPGGRERVTVTPESSQNVNGPAASSGGNLTINLTDASGGTVELLRQRIRSGGDADLLVRELFKKGRALGVSA